MANLNVLRIDKETRALRRPGGDSQPALYVLLSPEKCGKEILLAAEVPGLSRKDLVIDLFGGTRSLFGAMIPFLSEIELMRLQQK